MKIFIFCILWTIVQCVPQQGITGPPTYTRLTSDQIHHLQNRGFGPTVRSAAEFRPTVAYEAYDDEEYEDSEVQSSQDREPTYANYPVPVRTTVAKAYPTSPRPDKQRLQQQQYRRGEVEENNKIEEEKEQEEPDRLSLLLPQTKFNCNGKNTGYYADEELNCEVFHYCQDNARHSWICPEGFTFHQVHLICMPPGGDNICEKSSDYHFVNEFLYKPLNLEEYQHKPNVTLRYSDRYYPESYRSRYDDEDDQQQYQRPKHHQHSVRVVQQQPQHPQPIARPVSTTFRPQTSIGQVFRSPEEINISLQQRRPQYTTLKYNDY